MGKTTAVFAIANYLCSGENKWVACVELNSAPAFATYCGTKESRSFHKHGIDFYPNCDLTKYAKVLARPYDFIIVDFGVLQATMVSEFLRCHIPCIVGYASPWNRDVLLALNRKILMNNVMQKEIRCMGNLCHPEDVKLFRQQYRIPLVPIPYLDNPFSLTSMQCRFVERALHEEFLYHE